jgi:LIVCS family branched-chain amino acid:cation transporter
MSHSERSLTIATGLAMFSMFFGAGNVVFPISLGQLAQDKTLTATLGLLLTDPLIPLTGLMAMMLFNGSYHDFFGRLGKIPGAVVVFIIVILIGPAGATPRCISLSFATAKPYLSGVDNITFSAIACVLIYLLTFRKSKIIDVLGYFLTPLLLASLALIIFVGLLYHPEAPTNELTHLSLFTQGVLEGYNTMDLLGAFFFSHVVLLCLKREIDPAIAEDPKKMINMSLKASLIGAGLLALVYGGLAAVAAFHSESLAGVSQDSLMGALSIQVLGSGAGVIACVAVSLACLTTAVALCSVFAEYLQVELFRRHVNYPSCLLITLVLTFIVSTLEFEGIAAFLVPILQICYPALIVLSFLNLGHKLWGWEMVKTPVAMTFLGSVAWHCTSLPALLGS